MPPGSWPTRSKRLALYLDHDSSVPLGAAPASVAFATAFLRDLAPGRPLVAIHPGSGGERKNWPADRWETLGRDLLARGGEDRPRLLLVGGEADGKTIGALRTAWSEAARETGDVLVAENVPLPQLAAVLARAQLFLGHDSGISHLAAAAGTPCLLLFGPTDPDVWAPPYPHIRVLRSPEPHMGALDEQAVRHAVEEQLAG